MATGAKGGARAPAARPRAAAQPSPAAEAPAAAAAAPLPGSEQEYLGMVKSYNDRRGFGFVTCTETAARYGRDVYIAKAEAQLAFSEPGTVQTFGCGADKQPAPALAEEDLIRFRVRLSVEGYPQAERMRLVRKFHGTVVCAPAAEGEGGTDEHALVGRLASDEWGAAFGEREVVVRRSACGQVRLSAGDRVTFCTDDEGGAAAPRGGGRQAREALLVVLVPRPHQCVGSVLGCCVLNLPRAPLWEGGPPRADLQLDCHVLGDRVILAGLPPDVDDAELMRFFAKQGAQGAALAHSRSGSFASVSFPSMAEVVRFVARSIHTFADDKETRVARLLSRCACGPAMAVDNSRLPGLPPPSIMPGEEVGVLLIMWSPVVLATGYLVEMRPAGMQAPWAAVDASEGRLGSDSARQFDRHCSSCRVSGLPSNTVFEARVTYFTSCGCRSDASEPSEWCMQFPNAAPALGMAGMPATFATHPGACSGVPVGYGVGGNYNKYPWLNGPSCTTIPLQLSNHVGGAAFHEYRPAGEYHQAPMLATFAAPQQQLCMQSPGWRCAHGTVIPPPPIPELRAADESGFALLVQWPSVAHAAAYVVELLESGSQRVERFIRSMPAQSQGSLVELRVGGLRPGGPPGRCYVAQVRSVATCGCESEASPPGMSQPICSAAAQLSMAGACAPAGADFRGQAGPAYEERGKLGFAPPPAYAGGAPYGGGLPTLLQTAKSPTLPSPMGPPSATAGAAAKAFAPEVAGNEDCIFLD